MQTMDVLIDEFINGITDRNKLKTAKNILKGKTGYAFHNQLDYADPSCLNENIRGSIKKYGGSKSEAVKLYKGFVQFLKNKGVAAEVVFPPVDIGSELERQLYIAKYFQEEGHTERELEDILLVSDRTIKSDIAMLNGSGKDSLQINGCDFFIECMEPQRGRTGGQKFNSTMHPVFLPLNLSQVYVLLDGLYRERRGSISKSNTDSVAAMVWAQLTDYAKERLRKYLLINQKDFLEWLQSLETDNLNFFKLEEDSGGNHQLLNCIKNRKPVFLLYEDENGEIQEYDAYMAVPKSWDGRRIDIKKGKETHTLLIERVIRSATSKEALV